MSNNEQRCALILRSSKDRHDVSIDAQRRALLELAEKHRLTVAVEYADAVEAANDWKRPAFSRLLLDVERGDRDWDKILVFDTSRLARDINLARAFRQLCQRRGVKVMFVKIPDADPLSELVMGVVFELLDHIHSFLSREKGLAGMAENVRRGFRAGGVAPYGYNLVAVDTGKVRDGAAVTKSRLEPNDDATAVTAYLTGRVAGLPRRSVARQYGLRLKDTSLIDLEWRALTYAGHTVWNQTRSRGVGAGGYEGGTKRRPRADWLIQRDTHEPLISNQAAEAILARMEQRREIRSKGDTYLLSGILVASGGAKWHGDQGYYRCAGKRIKAERIEKLVLDTIGRDMCTDSIVKQATKLAREAVKPSTRDAELKALQRQSADLERKLGRVRNLMSAMERPDTMAPKLVELVDQKKVVDEKAAMLVDELAHNRVAHMITEEDTRTMLGGLANTVATYDRATTKAALRSLVNRIVLDPKKLTAEIHYAIPAAAGNMVASPRQSDTIPLIHRSRVKTA